MTRSMRVLVVDDRAVVRDTIRLVLADQNCVFEDALDGATAISRIAAQRFDVVFLDVRLTDVSGIDVLREVRLRNLVVGPVIIITGMPTVATRNEAAALGAFCYLAKPMQREEIRAVFAAARNGSG